MIKYPSDPMCKGQVADRSVYQLLSHSEKSVLSIAAEVIVISFLLPFVGFLQGCIRPVDLTQGGILAEGAEEFDVSDAGQLALYTPNIPKKGSTVIVLLPHPGYMHRGFAHGLIAWNTALPMRHDTATKGLRIIIASAKAKHCVTYFSPALPNSIRNSFIYHKVIQVFGYTQTLVNRFCM
jgi:hypothetical protein